MSFHGVRRQWVDTIKDEAILRAEFLDGYVVCHAGQHTYVVPDPRNARM